MLRKVLLFILAAVMVFSVIGCENQPTSENINPPAVEEKKEIIEEEKQEEPIVEEVKEPEAPVVDENKLIDDEGCTYDVNLMYQFPNSSMTIKRVKIKKDYGYYLMFFDFDVENISDKPITWRIQYNDNNIGSINAGLLVDKSIGGNSRIYDDDFTVERENYDLKTLNVGEVKQYYKLGIFDWFTPDIKQVDLKEKEPMTITLYYKENDIKYPFEIKLNQE